MPIPGGTGIVDSNKLQKHNITFRETASFFNDRLKLDGNASLMTQTIRNTPAGGGYYLNPLVASYLFPRGADWLPTLKTLKFSILTAI